MFTDHGDSKGAGEDVLEVSGAEAERPTPTLSLRHAQL